jgi:hypothetical protein
MLFLGIEEYEMKITILISQFGDNTYTLTGIKPKLLKYQHFFKNKN